MTAPERMRNMDLAPLLVPIPRPPITGSPVPGLTSLYHNPDPGPYGNRGYPGNCPGTLIRDLLKFFGSRSVFDPMTGSGTCRDVCRELRIPCFSADIKSGFDAADFSMYPRERFGFVWLHPPYWRQKVYSTNPKDLSTAPTLEKFAAGYFAVLQNCAKVLEPGGRLAVLMGDYSDRERGFCPLVHITKHLLYKLGLKQKCTDIIRFSHGASSGKKVYKSSFIPGLHDVCVVVEKDQGTR